MLTNAQSKIDPITLDTMRAIIKQASREFKQLANQLAEKYGIPQTTFQPGDALAQLVFNRDVAFKYSVEDIVYATMAPLVESGRVRLQQEPAKVVPLRDEVEEVEEPEEVEEVETEEPPPAEAKAKKKKAKKKAAKKR